MDKIKAIALTCYAGAAILVIDVLKIGSVTGEIMGIERHYYGVFGNPAIQYLVIAGLVGLGSYLFMKKK